MKWDRGIDSMRKNILKTLSIGAWLHHGSVHGGFMDVPPPNKGQLLLPPPAKENVKQSTYVCSSSSWPYYPSQPRALAASPPG